MDIKERIQSILTKHWLLLPLFITTTFGFGYQTIPLFTWLYIPTILSYNRNQQDYQTIFFTYLVSSIGFSLGYLGNFNTVSINDKGPRFPLFWVVILCSFAIHLLLVVALFAEKFTIQRYQGHKRAHLIRIVFFPCLWTSIWCLMTRYGPLGDFISLSTSLVIWPEFGQIASIGGRSLLDFLMVLFGTILVEFIFPTKEEKNEDQEEEEEEETIPSSGRRRLAVLSSILMALILVYGGARVNIHSNSFYQVNYPDYVPKTEQVGCVVGPGGSDSPQLQTQQDIWLNMTRELAESGAKLVLWSELTAFVNDLEEEKILIGKAKDLARTYQIYLGISYGTVNQNKLVFITKQGEIGFDFNKAHPVPGIETQPAGPNVLQYIDTEEFGRIGGAICFDFNFPSFISQASTHNIDIMLQPSWTWGPTGTYHEQTNIIRAVENGFTLFRCVSQGVSGIYEPTLNGIFNQK
ncbi:carbon-nitrogen hydrolase [Cokeromyces recurvatus]|uniref:carbon-nitrogen hydrolase n=1 Tax=Cokeromyces recurvatus TaxID=90255 RepID=UPI0022204CF7|nr:carbon-nitrogen hydrolase [Cokeromyces recurvatus]XP_051380183.1 carbon-nitrogen hydrolase [Cokeromyces recurvatus]KAI7899088.1 carbon-nitrogen hydrolase [Cokeromyces recurvatus]KAI7900198.1 carbon-nitrogen hydrolase [Cokeromyces recurvatus]